MFTKIFKSIYYGSLSDKSDARELFICICAHADATGFVDMNLRSFGLVLRWPNERLEAAASQLLNTDSESTTSDSEGRRIIADGSLRRGIHVVNYIKYRNLRNTDDRKEYQRRYFQTVTKAKRKAESTQVNTGQVESTRSTQAEAEAEADRNLGGGREGSESSIDILVSPSVESSEPAAFTMPTVGLGPKEFLIYDRDIEAWRTLYPAVDVPTEIRKMLGWFEGNPYRRKTAKGALRFIHGWLAKQQDRSAAVVQVPPTPATPGLRPAGTVDPALAKARNDREEWEKDNSNA